MGDIEGNPIGAFDDYVCPLTLRLLCASGSAMPSFLRERRILRALAR